MADRSDEVFVVDALQDDLDIPLEEPGLGEVVGLQGVGVGAVGIGAALGTGLGGGALLKERSLSKFYSLRSRQCFLTLTPLIMSVTW